MVRGHAKKVFKGQFRIILTAWSKMITSMEYYLDEKKIHFFLVCNKIILLDSKKLSEHLKALWKSFECFPIWFL